MREGGLTMRKALVCRSFAALLAAGIALASPAGAAVANASIFAGIGQLQNGGQSVTVPLWVRCPPGWSILYPELYLVQTTGHRTAQGMPASGTTLKECPWGLALATATDVGSSPFTWGLAQAKVGVALWQPGVTYIPEQYVTQTIWLG